MPYQLGKGDEPFVTTEIEENKKNIELFRQVERPININQNIDNQLQQDDYLRQLKEVDDVLIDYIERRRQLIQLIRKNDMYFVFPVIKGSDILDVMPFQRPQPIVIPKAPPFFSVFKDINLEEVNKNILSQEDQSEYDRIKAERETPVYKATQEKLRLEKEIIIREEKRKKEERGKKRQEIIKSSKELIDGDLEYKTKLEPEEFERYIKTLKKVPQYYDEMVKNRNPLHIYQIYEPYHNIPENIDQTTIKKEELRHIGLQAKQTERIIPAKIKEDQLEFSKILRKRGEEIKQPKSENQNVQQQKGFFKLPQKISPEQEKKDAEEYLDKHKDIIEIATKTYLLRTMEEFKTRMDKKKFTDDIYTDEGKKLYPTEEWRKISKSIESIVDKIKNNLKPNENDLKNIENTKYFDATFKPFDRINNTIGQKRIVVEYLGRQKDSGSGMKKLHIYGKGKLKKKKYITILYL